MKLEVGLDSLTQASRSLDRAAREVEELKQELDQAKNSLSSKTRNTGSVESTFNRIHRQLDEMQQQLEQMSQLVSRKRDEYEEADRNGEDIDVGKMFSFALAAASLVLDFVPFVGNVKGIIEAVTGRDLLTGEKLEAWERVLGVMGPLGKGVSKAVKVAKYADEVVNVVGEATRHADDVTGAVSSATRNADDLAGSVSATSKGKTVTQAAENGADDLSSAGSKTSSKAGNSAEQAERSSEGMDAAPSSTKRNSVDSESAPHHNETVNATDHHSVASDATIAAVTGASALAATGKVSKTMNGANKSAEATKVTKNLEHTSDVSKKMANTEKSVQAQDVTKSNIKSCAVDPIHMATGHQFIDHDALSLYGAAVWPFRMLYHSGRLQQGALGKAWTHNYVVRLEIGDATEQQQPAQEPSEDQRKLEQDIQPSWITVHYTEGRRSVFHLQPSGVYRSKDLDVRQDELQSTEQGYVLTSRQPREVHTFDPEGRLIRVTNAEQLSLELTYDDEGLLTHLTDEITRRQFTLTYDDQHRVTSVRDAGRVIQMEYDDHGCFVRFTDATGIETEFTNDEYGRLISLTQDGITKFTNTFDDQHRIIGQSDASGHMSWLHYDLDSRPGQIVTILINRLGDQRTVVHNEQLQLLEVQEEDGNRTTYTYHENGQQASVTNALGETIRYEYDEHGQLIGEIDPLEHVTEYSYTSDHLLSQIVDAEGSVTEYRYDEAGRQTAIVRPDGSTAYWSYTDSGQVEQYIDFNGGISRYDYDAQGNLRAYTDAAGRTTQVQLDDVGRITTLEDAAGGVSHQYYDGDDNLVKRINAEGRSWTTVYDGFGSPIQRVQPSGAASRYTYTPNGKIATVTNAIGETVQYTYDAEDRLIAETNALGETATLRYDAVGRLEVVIDPLGRETTYQHDAVGRLLSVQDADGHVVQQLTYDSLGRPIALQDGLGHTSHYRFNSLHQLLETQDADGRTSHFRYDVNHRLIEVMQIGTQAETATYQQTFDGEDQLTSYTDAEGNSTQQQYDASGRLVQITNASGHALHYAYDERGWLHRQTGARGQQTHYVYDASGRLLQQRDEVGTIDLSYTEDGQLNRIEENGAVQEKVYDALGQLIQSTDEFGHVIRYAYDAAGRLTHLTYPDGKVVEYRYTAAGELSEVKDWNGRLTAYRYDHSGRLIQTRRPNGSREERSYDAVGQLTRLTDTSGLGIRLQQFRYTYSPAGQLLQEEDRQYTYDNFKRLIHGQLPDQTIRYTYDRAGNLTEEQRELAGIASSRSSSLASTQQWFYQADNRLLRVGEYPVELDADGNLLYATDGEQMGAYEYDARNRLIQSGRLRYRYSASGNRIEMRQRKSVIRYVVDESSPLSRMLMEVNEEGEALAWYVYGLGLIGREDADGQYLSYHSDLRGSTTILTNEASQVTDRYTYGLYGELESHEGRTNQPFRYNGRDGVQTDPNGLYYMRARYYDPKLKRFLNRDVIQGTIIDGQTFNRYAYVNGNPVSYVDPLGLEKAKLGNCSANNPYPTRAIDPATEGHILDRVRELRFSLTSDLKKSGNFALAEVNIIGNSQKEYFAHSGIDKLTGTLAERVPTISLQPKNPVFKSTWAAGGEGTAYSRASDTEYKIINHLANQLGEQTTVSGNIKLFTELDTCSSCNRIIAEFASKYKNIAVEVIHNNGERLNKKL